MGACAWRSVKVAGSLRSNDNEALLEATRRGVGILAGGDWLMGEDLAAGRLVRLLPQWQLNVAAGIYLVRPTARLNTAALGPSRRGWKHASRPVRPGGFDTRPLSGNST